MSWFYIEITFDNYYTDWSHRDDIKAELKVDLILTLVKMDIPPFPQTKCLKRFLSKQRTLRSIMLSGTRA